MKNIWSIVLLTVVASCGNPHISSEKNGIERISPPIEASCDPISVDVSDYRFFDSSEAPTDYLNFIKCKKITREDFTTFADGSAPELSNGSRVDQPYVLTHRSEINHDVDKVDHLEDIFGSSTYDILVQNPVANNGDTGADRGAHSGNLENTFKDSLVWKFTSPISFWSARPVGLKNNSTLRLFNCSESLLNEYQIDGGSKFIGFISAFENVCYVSLSAADGQDAVAVDDFEYGH